MFGEQCCCSLFFFSRPVENDTKIKPGEQPDAASLIAEALKRKFAHRYRHDSGQEEREEFKLPIPEVKPQSETLLVRDS